MLLTYSRINLHQHKDKTLDIAAHSSGGLVARWYIEQEGGKDIVNSLWMMGTPNAGSLYGVVENYRSFGLSILELAANVLPSLIPGAGLLIKALKFAGNLTPALGQMSPDSEFLTRLNTSADPGIDYHILAGKVGENYDPQVMGLMNRIYKKTADLVNAGEEHDLFVKIQSALMEDIFDNRSLAQVHKEPIDGHHFEFIQKIKI